VLGLIRSHMCRTEQAGGSSRRDAQIKLGGHLADEKDADGFVPDVRVQELT
jgi:hypothetical protein